MDKLRRVLSGREENEELGLTAQASYCMTARVANASVM